MAFAVGASVCAPGASAATIKEPTVFASVNGALDLLVIARTTIASGVTAPGYSPVALGYQVCARPTSGNACPANTPTDYGGVFALQPGDLLKIRLANLLPAVDPATLDRDDDALLPLDPTNLHTHGVIVDATPNTALPPATPVYGDFVFTSVFNTANGDPTQVNLNAYNTLHARGDVVKGGMVDYRIQLPANHPCGMFWFHPHMHGIAVNQISAGLSGILSVGRSVTTPAPTRTASIQSRIPQCATLFSRTCRSFRRLPAVRHTIGPTRPSASPIRRSTSRRATAPVPPTQAYIRRAENGSTRSTASRSRLFPCVGPTAKSGVSRTRAPAEPTILL